MVMHRSLPACCATVIVTGCFLLAQQPVITAAPQKTVATQNRSNKLNAPEGADHQSLPAPEVSKIKEQAWHMIEHAATKGRLSDRATAVSVLGLMPNDTRAVKLAEKALKDDKAEVRAAAAAALGGMNSRRSIPNLRMALDDSDPLVVLAAAHALDLLHDKSAYEVYYEVLNGERKTGKGLIASQTSILSDPKKMAQLGFEEGIGFVPFAGIGWGAIKAMTKDDVSPIRAAAAKVLAKDPDPATTKALIYAAGDKKWLVRAAALEALAKRGDPSCSKR
jgi:HEAT repeat protein